jgi:hypothetical protein
VTILLAAARLLLLALFGATSLVGEHGLATRFGDPGDRHDGAALSCTQKPLEAGQLVCAHRTLPCGSVVMLHNPRTNRYAVCTVLDRGPYGAILPSGKWGLKIHKSQPGVWRGVIDLAPAVARALGHNGFERVDIYYQRVAQHLRVGRGVPRAAAKEPR